MEGYSSMDDNPHKIIPTSEGNRNRSNIILASKGGHSKRIDANAKEPSEINPSFIADVGFYQPCNEETFEAYQALLSIIEYQLESCRSLHVMCLVASEIIDILKTEDMDSLVQKVEIERLINPITDCMFFELVSVIDVIKNYPQETFSPRSREEDRETFELLADVIVSIGNSRRPEADCARQILSILKNDSLSKYWKKRKVCQHFRFLSRANFNLLVSIADKIHYFHDGDMYPDSDEDEQDDSKSDLQDGLNIQPRKQEQDMCDTNKGCIDFLTDELLKDDDLKSDLQDGLNIQHSKDQHNCDNKGYNVDLLTSEPLTDNDLTKDQMLIDLKNMDADAQDGSKSEATNVKNTNLDVKDESKSEQVTDDVLDGSHVSVIEKEEVSDQIHEDNNDEEDKDWVLVDHQDHQHDDHDSYGKNVKQNVH